MQMLKVRTHVYPLSPGFFQRSVILHLGRQSRASQTLQHLQRVWHVICACPVLFQACGLYVIVGIWK